MPSRKTEIATGRCAALAMTTTVSGRTTGIATGRCAALAMTPMRHLAMTAMKDLEMAVPIERRAHLQYRHCEPAAGRRGSLGVALANETRRKDEIATRPCGPLAMTTTMPNRKTEIATGRCAALAMTAMKHLAMTPMKDLEMAVPIERLAHLQYRHCEPAAGRRGSLGVALTNESCRKTEIATGRCAALAMTRLS